MFPIQVFRNAVGGVKFSWEKHYEDAYGSMLLAFREWVGVHFPGKKALRNTRMAPSRINFPQTCFPSKCYVMQWGGGGGGVSNFLGKSITKVYFSMFFFEGMGGCPFSQKKALRNP